MTTKVSVYDYYPGFVSVELPYNLPPVVGALINPRKGQKPLTPEQLNGTIINLLTPGLRIACDHAKRLPPPGLNVRLTMVGGTNALLDLVAYIVTRQGLHVAAEKDNSTHLNYSGGLVFFRRQIVYTIASTLQVVQRSKPSVFHSVWS